MNSTEKSDGLEMTTFLNSRSIGICSGFSLIIAAEALIASIS